MKPFSVRPGTPDDVEAIARLIASMDPIALGSPELGVEERIERLRGLFEAGRNVHFVAEASDGIIGELTLTLNWPRRAGIQCASRMAAATRGHCAHQGSGGVGAIT